MTKAEIIKGLDKLVWGGVALSLLIKWFSLWSFITAGIVLFVYFKVGRPFVLSGKVQMPKEKKVVKTVNRKRKLVTPKQKKIKAHMRKVVKSLRK